MVAANCGRVGGVATVAAAVGNGNGDGDAATVPAALLNIGCKNGGSNSMRNGFGDWNFCGVCCCDDGLSSVSKTFSFCERLLSWLDDVFKSLPPDVKPGPLVSNCCCWKIGWNCDGCGGNEGDGADGGSGVGCAGYDDADAWSEST